MAGEIARSNRTAPVILFRRTLGPLDECKFDKVYWSAASPRVWLNDIAGLIARTRAATEQSRMQREESQRLRLDAQAVRTETRRQLARLQAELRRNKDGSVP